VHVHDAVTVVDRTAARRIALLASSSALISCAF